MLDGFCEDLSHYIVKSSDGRCSQTGRDPIWMQLGAKQNFICIDISDSRNTLLMHEQGLESTAPSFYNTQKVLPRDR